MARDEDLAAEVRRGEAPPTLRIYGWVRPAISIGRRQRPDDSPADLLSQRLPMVRRPTGGGAVVHSPEELTYALAMPLPVPLVPGTEGTRYRVGGWYRKPLRDLPGRLHQALRDLLVTERLFRPEELTVAEGNCRGPFIFCFDAPVCGDLLYRGKKAAGSALRVWRDGLLIQGSIQGLPVESDRLAEAVSSIATGDFLHEESIVVR